MCWIGKHQSSFLYTRWHFIWYETIWNVTVQLTNFGSLIFANTWFGFQPTQSIEKLYTLKTWNIPKHLHRYAYYGEIPVTFLDLHSSTKSSAYPRSDNLLSCEMWMPLFPHENRTICVIISMTKFIREDPREQCWWVPQTIVKSGEGLPEAPTCLRLFAYSDLKRIKFFCHFSVRGSDTDLHNHRNGMPLSSRKYRRWTYKAGPS